MKTSQPGIDLIKSFEGLRLHAYKDSVGVYTIGYGTIMYNDGKKVRAGQVITKDKAEELLLWQIRLKEFSVIRLLHPYVLSQTRFDALVSFTYNCGVGALESSTLLKKVRANPDDPTVRNELLKWNKGRVNGKLVVLAGLTKRRKKEADFYFSII